MPASDIRYELFTTDADGPRIDRGRPVQARPGDEMYTIEFTLDGQSSTVESPVVGERVDPGCRAARSRRRALRLRGRSVRHVPRAPRRGQVRMTQNYALEPEELDRGYVLTCQSHPETPRVVVDYDV